MLFVCYPNCSTCAKARSWLTEQGFTFTERDIKRERPTAKEFKAWIDASGLPVKRWFNTSGMVYRELGIKDKLAGISEKQAIELLASDGMLVKRPILIDGSVILLGFKATEWEERLR